MIHVSVLGEMSKTAKAVHGFFPSFPFADRKTLKTKSESRFFLSRSPKDQM